VKRQIEVVTQDELASSYGFQRTFVDALPLLVGMAFLMAGSGLTATLLGVRAGLEGFSPTVTGAVLSAFYLGFLAGSMITPGTIWRVGHVRVFAGLASLASAAVLLHVIRPEPFSWFVLRAVSGLCLAGLYVVTETWLNGAATNRTRGGLLAGYMVVVTGAMAIGKLLFSVADPGGYAIFVLASVLVSIAVVPVSLATVSPPKVSDVQRMSAGQLYAAAPLAVVGAWASGFSGAAIIGGGGGVYASAAGLSQGETSALLFAALVGALALQVPFGRWSDRTDRRRVLTAAAVLGSGAAVLAVIVGSDSIVPLAGLSTVIGGVSFLLYSLGNAHLNDHLEPDRVVGAGAGMVLAFGAGAVAGPVAVSAGIDVAGPEALFVLLAASYVAVAAFGAWRMSVAPAVPEEERAVYSPVTMGTAPTVATLAEATPEAHYRGPVEEEVVATRRGDLPYRIQGSGPPVILLGAAADPASWDKLLRAFAADGVQAVGVELRATGPDDGGPLEDLLEVLRDLELPSATFVGLNGGAVQVAEFVARHPDRTDAVVFAGPALPVAAEATELQGRALLVLTDDWAVPYWDEPELFADTVVDFVRHAVPTPSETGEMRGHLHGYEPSPPTEKAVGSAPD
jgi:MFS family permease